MKPFALERWFAAYEHCTKYLLCCSDCESITVSELLELADSHTRNDFMSTKLTYGESSGKPELCEVISKQYKSISSNNVLVHVGAEEGIYCFARSMLKAGDHVIVPWPSYQSLSSLPEEIGCDISYWRVREGEGNKWHYSIDELSSLIRPNTKCIFMNSPHNPTGAVFSNSECHQIVDLCRTKANNCYLFSDEVYRDLYYNLEDQPAALCDLYENAASLGVLSKAYGLPGLRIGWICTRSEEIMNNMRSYKDYLTICCPIISEKLAIIALENKNKLIERNLALSKKNIEVAKPFFKRFTHIFEWEAPKAGVISYPKLKIPIDSASFAIDLVKKKNVLLLPSSCYDPEDTHHFRLSFARADFPICLQKLEEYLTEQSL